MSGQHLESSIFGEQPQERPDTGPATSPRAHSGRHPAGPDGPRAHHRHTAEAAAHVRRERRRRGGRRLLVMLVALAVVGGAGFVAVSYLRPLFAGGESNDYAGDGSGEVVVTVVSGDTGRSIGRTLESAGVVKTAEAFADAAADNPDAAGIQPGRYTMRKQMSAAAALGLLLDPANKTVPRVTLREGLWTSEVLAQLSKATGTPIADYTAAAKDTETIGLPAAAKGNLSGYLFPDTYEFEPDAGAATQLRTLVARTLAVLEELDVGPERYQRTLTVASLVEAEARLPTDRPRVARVVENRLSQGMPLQLDSTVAFLRQQRGKITTSDEERRNPSPYNTYRHDGLPPGPIGNPGRSSILAALRPAAGGWLFFVTVNPETGETRFNETAAGHEEDVQVFQAWCRAHPDTC